MIGGGNVGAALVESKEVDLVSFTGSEARGKLVGAECAMRFKQSLLELGGNNVSVLMHFRTTQEVRLIYVVW